MICKTSSAYAKWAPSSWPVKPAAIAASVGLHALVLAGAGWLIGTAQPEHTHAKRLDIALVPAQVSTTQSRQHNIRHVKARPAPTRHQTVKPAPSLKAEKSRPLQPAPTGVQAAALPAQANQAMPPRRQAASEITAATTVHHVAQGLGDNRKPAYPAMSRRLGEEGTVLLKILVTTEGKVGQVDLLKSSGYPLLDEAAMQGVRQWQFRPATRNGQPVAEWYKQPIPFDLSDKS